MPQLDIPAGTEGGFTQQVPREAPATPAEVGKYNALVEKWKGVGVSDLDKLDPKLVVAMHQRLQELTAAASPAQIERLAHAKLAELRAAEAAAGEEEEEEAAGQKSDMEKLLERLERLEGGVSEKETSEHNLQEQAGFQQQWVSEYARAQQQYPVLQEPAVDNFFRTVMIGHMATTNDPAADDPGYVSRVIPGFLQAFVEANVAFNGMVPTNESAANGGGAPKSFTHEQIGKMSDDEFGNSLRPYIVARGGR